MKVSGILKDKGSDVVTIPAEESLKSAAETMARFGIGAVVIMDGGDVAGILSERDIVKAVAAEGAGALDEQVRTAMTQNVVTCSLDDSADQLMDVMTGRRFRHLPVIDGGALVGIISIGDVVKHRFAEKEMETEALRSYIATG